MSTSKMTLTKYLSGLRAATTAEELESAIQVPFRHAFHGRTWSMISSARIEAGQAICASHPDGKYVPRIEGRNLIVCGESYRMGRGGNSTGVRYAWHSAGEFCMGVLKRHGLSQRACARVWDVFSSYPHRALDVIAEWRRGELQDPVLDVVTYCYTGSGPVSITVAGNAADDIDRRATMPCRCGGTLFDWGSGNSSGFNFVNWHCNACADVFQEYVSPARFAQIRRPAWLEDSLVAA